jgi:hypothetical protein
MSLIFSPAGPKKLRSSGSVMGGWSWVMKSVCGFRPGPDGVVVVGGMAEEGRVVVEEEEAPLVGVSLEGDVVLEERAAAGRLLRLGADGGRERAAPSAGEEAATAAAAFVLLLLLEEAAAAAAGAVGAPPLVADGAEVLGTAAGPFWIALLLFDETEAVGPRALLLLAVALALEEEAAALCCCCCCCCCWGTWWIQLPPDCCC